MSKKIVKENFVKGRFYIRNGRKEGKRKGEGWKEYSKNQRGDGWDWGGWGRFGTF